MSEKKEISFDSRVFSVEAVKNAAYRLAREIDSEIRVEGNEIVCSVRMRKETIHQDMDGVLEHFRREVIDHDLRIRIRENTEATRNLILAHAFSRTGLVSSE
jgi:His-Xaa-Ser system protein HxsD